MPFRHGFPNTTPWFFCSFAGERQVFACRDIGEERQGLVAFEDDHELNRPRFDLGDEQGALGGTYGDTVHIGLGTGRIGGELDPAVGIIADNRAKGPEPLTTSAGAHLGVVEGAADESCHLIVSSQETVANAACADPVAEGDDFQLGGKDHIHRTTVVGHRDEFNRLLRALGGLHEIAPDTLGYKAGTDVLVAFRQIGHAQLILPFLSRHRRGKNSVARQKPAWGPLIDSSVTVAVISSVR